MEQVESKIVQFPIRGNKLSMNVEVRKHLHHQVTPFQTIDIYETEAFGKVLFLDGHIQLTTLDEKAYHECLVQIPMLNLPDACTALVIGGGDGGAIRELVRHRKIQSVDIVEIDGAVIEACKKHLPSLSKKAFDNPKVKLFVADAFPFIKNKKETYDLIVADSTDTYEDQKGAISEALFTREFYQDCLEALTPGGVVVTQADNPVFCKYSVKEIQRQFEQVFPVVGTYVGLVPSFGGYSAFVYGSHSKKFCKGWNFYNINMDYDYINPSTYNLAFNDLPF